MWLVSTNEKNGLPLRGIAMIIIAVAVLLLAWGIYSMTNSGKSDDVVVAKNDTTSQNAPATKAPGAPAPAATPNATVAPGTAAPATASSAVPAPSGEAGASTSAKPKVIALNNSTVQGLANRVADKLKAKGYNEVESGNFPNEVLPKSVVFYREGNAEEKQAAENLARDLGIAAQPRIDALKDKPAGVVLVITEDLNR